MKKDTFTIEKFIDPSQWAMWKFQVRVNLLASELFGYVDGTVQKPEPAAGAAATAINKNIAEWLKNDAKAQKVMVNSCGSKVLIHLCNCTTQMWDKLHAVYEQSNQASKHLLQEQFFVYKKDPAHDIATHVSTLEGLVQKLKTVGVNIDDSMLITKILMTLPSEYRHFSSAWESTAANDRTIINLTNRLMVEEQRLGIQNFNLNEVSSSQALVAKQQTGAKGKQNQRNQKKTGKTKQKGKCFKCGSTEHWKRDCPSQLSSEKSKASEETDEKAFFGSETESLVQHDC